VGQETSFFPENLNFSVGSVFFCEFGEFCEINEFGKVHKIHKL